MIKSIGDYMKKFKFAPYSHSKITCYENCPKAFEFKYIKKIKIVLDPRFFEKGNFYHETLEKYPKKIDFKFKFAEPEQIEIYKKNIKKFIDSNNIESNLLDRFGAEVEFKFDSELNPTEISKWKSALYGYIDFIGKEDDNIVIIDWKSKDHGDRFPTNEKQLQMYAAWAFAIRPNLQKVICKFAYVENCSGTAYEYSRKDGEQFKIDILERIDKIEQDELFERKIKKGCASCDYFKMCKPHKIRIKR